MSVLKLRTVLRYLLLEHSSTAFVLYVCCPDGLFCFIPTERYAVLYKSFYTCSTVFVALSKKTEYSSCSLYDADTAKHRPEH